MRKRLKKKFKGGRPLYSLRGLRGKTRKAYNYFSSFMLLFCIIFFTVSCTSFRAGVEGLEKGEIVIERSGNMVSMKINGGV